ncbi:MAG TPA: signal peptidase I [Candidatus Doudnabacteria bacterium]|nr:signal peptidase I [Candidatus Doudnabacteria bacterium]
MSEQKIVIESANEDEIQPSSGSFLWELIRIIVVAFVVMVAFRVFVAEPFVVSGSSMVPNFHNKEYLVVDKVSYRLGEPKRGDVIVFKYPKDTSQYFIKRVIGLPGERVQVDNGRVKVFNDENPEGAILTEPYLTSEDATFGKTDIVTLGSSEYYVLGDNRLASSDSRVWGVLPDHNIIGKAWFRAFPLAELGFPSFPDPIIN